MFLPLLLHQLHVYTFGFWINTMKQLDGSQDESSTRSRSSHDFSCDAPCSSMFSLQSYLLYSCLNQRSEVMMCVCRLIHRIPLSRFLGFLFLLRRSVTAHLTSNESAWKEKLLHTQSSCDHSSNQNSLQWCTSLIPSVKSAWELQETWITESWRVSPGLSWTLHVQGQRSVKILLELKCHCCHFRPQILYITYFYISEVA